MRFFRGKDGILQIERRANSRVLVECLVRLRMPSGDRPGKLVNISEWGAGLQLADPPRAGLCGYLEWKSYLFMCEIAWASASTCGLLFNDPIPHAVIARMKRLSRG